MAATKLFRPQSEGLQTRIEDYLNDKLQTSTDIDGIENILTDVRNRQQLLKKQLEDANEALENARKASQDHATMVEQKAEEFQRRQSEIDRRLVVITQSETSDEAVRKFQSSMSKLHRLEIATGYMELLQEADKLSSNARQILITDPRSSVASYARLRTLATALKEAQPAAEGAAPHLIDQVEKSTAQLRSHLEENLKGQLQKTLDEMGWPKKDLRPSDELLGRWSEQVGTLLDLQEPDLAAVHVPSSTSSDREVPVLLPLEVMVHPLALRFRYHFYGDKPTNRLDKPEYFLSHVSDVLDQYSSFVSDFLQPLLDSRTKALDLDDAIYTDAISSLITALLPMVSAKCLSVLPQISSEPQLLSHFVHELMSFDNALRESWAYAPAPQITAEWKGLTWSILTSQGYFDTWLGAERQFALSRYKSIRDSPEGGDLDLESTGPQSTKPTKSAIRVNDLLETITDRYRSLVSFSQKLRFLLEIQLAIFDDYHSYLTDGLQAYMVASHTAGRLIQGQGLADQGSFSLKGLESLTKIFGSSEYLEKKMSDWSDDIFFLELWDELQDRARRNAKRMNSTIIGRDLDINEVAAKTSATIAMQEESAGESDGGALFDETAASYRRLRERSEEQILRVTDVNIRSSIRPFTSMGGRASLSSGPVDSSVLSQSASLDGLTQTLSALLGFLYTVLAPGPLRRITRQACHSIQKDIWDNALMRHTFSLSGFAQFRRDITALQDVIDSNIKAPGEAVRGMRKLEEAMMLLGLPIRASGRTAKPEQDDEENWGFTEEQEDENTMLDDEKIWGLWEVEKRLNLSNESARQVLAEMGLTQLREKEARDIVGRRVEVKS